ncbi:MAG: hypothetical protein IPP42_09925 [Saprospiraceae bacterium]|nr:hypothetical protein [Saprospiraceae bacterium]
MERTQFYSKEEIARDLGISLKTLLRRVTDLNDEALMIHYRKQRLFFHVQSGDYILDRINQYVNSTDPAGGKSI